MRLQRSLLATFIVLSMVLSLAMPALSVVTSRPVAAFVDVDEDEIDDATDNCPTIANSDQADTDFDGIGDACDLTPNGDDDGDGVDNLADNCPPGRQSRPGGC